MVMRHSHGGRGGKIGAALREVFAPHSHDASDSIDDALESSAAGIRAVKISLLALGATSIAQLVIVLVSGSVALLADTIHNFSDALTADSVVDRVRARHQGRYPALHLRIRSCRRPRRDCS